MSVSMPGSGKGDRRRTIADLNLVPYIDLLTCMVAFLLITAVWTQLAQLKTDSRPPGGDVDATMPQTRIVVIVSRGGFNLVVNTDSQPLPKGAAGYDFAGLNDALKKVKAHHPDKDDALVASDDDIAFETLVGAMDAMLSAGFPLVSLVDSGETKL